MIRQAKSTPTFNRAIRETSLGIWTHRLQRPVHVAMANAANIVQIVKEGFREASDAILGIRSRDPNTLRKYKLRNVLHLVSDVLVSGMQRLNTTDSPLYYSPVLAAECMQVRTKDSYSRKYDSFSSQRSQWRI